MTDGDQRDDRDHDGRERGPEAHDRARLGAGGRRRGESRQGKQCGCYRTAANDAYGRPVADPPTPEGHYGGTEHEATLNGRSAHRPGETEPRRVQCDHCRRAGRGPRHRVMSRPQRWYGDAEQYGERTSVGDEHRPPRRAGNHSGRPCDRGDTEHTGDRRVTARRCHRDGDGERQDGDGVTLRISRCDERAEIGVPQHIQPGCPGQRVRREWHQRRRGENSRRDVRADCYAPARPPMLRYGPRRSSDRECHDGRDDERIERCGDDSHPEHREPEFDDGRRDRGDAEVRRPREPARPGEYGSHHGNCRRGAEDGSEVVRTDQAAPGDGGRDRQRQEREDPREDVFGPPAPAPAGLPDGARQ